MGFWKSSKEHESKGKTSRIGKSHFDVYKTNESGKLLKPPIATLVKTMRYSCSLSLQGASISRSGIATKPASARLVAS